MIKNDLPKEVIFALLILGVSASFLGFSIQLLLDKIQNGGYWPTEGFISVIVLLISGVFGFFAGFGLIYKKRLLVKIGQIAFLICIILVGGLLLENIGEFSNDIFSLLSVFSIYFGGAAFIMLLLGNRHLFPWLDAENKKERQF